MWTPVKRTLLMCKFHVKAQIIFNIPGSAFPLKKKVQKIE